MVVIAKRWWGVSAVLLISVCGAGFAGMVWQPRPTASVVTSRDLSFVAPSEVGLSAERLKRLDDGLQAMVDDGKLAGVVTLLSRHGKIAFVDVAGVQDVESQRPMSRDSIFRIYSMTKPIVGVAMMKRENGV